MLERSGLSVVQSICLASRAGSAARSSPSACSGSEKTARKRWSCGCTWVPPPAIATRTPTWRQPDVRASPPRPRGGREATEHGRKGGNGRAQVAQRPSTDEAGAAPHKRLDRERLLREAKLVVDTRDALRGVAGDRSKVYGL